MSTVTLMKLADNIYSASSAYRGPYGTEIACTVCNSDAKSSIQVTWYMDVPTAKKYIQELQNAVDDAEAPLPDEQ